MVFTNEMARPHVARLLNEADEHGLDLESDDAYVEVRQHVSAGTINDFWAKVIVQKARWIARARA